MTLTVDALRGHIETGLGDDELGLLLDAAYEAIDLTVGPADSVSELLSAGSGDLLMLSRAAASITSVTECDVELEADDYALVGDQVLRRVATGPNPRRAWTGRVEIAYVPVDDANERDRVAIGLVNLDLNYDPGLTAERLGDHTITYRSGGGTTDSYAVEREELLATLTRTGFVGR